jgi:hypothetical protein
MCTQRESPSWSIAHSRKRYIAARSSPGSPSDSRITGNTDGSAPGTRARPDTIIQYRLGYPFRLLVRRRWLSLLWDE